MLPEVAGLDLLRQARAKGVRTPVVILTALGAVEERVAGLRDGADDYLVKPFAFHELLARLEAVRRRASNRPAHGPAGRKNPLGPDQPPMSPAQETRLTSLPPASAFWRSSCETRETS